MDGSRSGTGVDEDRIREIPGWGEKGHVLEQKGQAFVSEHEREIDAIVELARGKMGKDLELISTIVYVAKTEGRDDRDVSPLLLERVAELKPKFSSVPITERAADFRRRGYL